MEYCIEMKKITFEEVSTKNAEDTFMRIILKKSLQDSKANYQTFFLNGVWGSGKTTFLNNVEKQAVEIKFINLKLWELRDERSVIAIAYSLLHPFQYLFVQVLVLCAVVMSIVMTPAINFGLSGAFSSDILIIGTVIALLVTVYQFLKVKSDSLYIRLLPHFLKNKVLIIDDFDRISVERQNESYKLFNILHGKLPIVFIGDYSKISKSDEESGKYLQKIIDRRLELPSSLNSKTIWNSYLSKLSSSFEIEDNIFRPGIISIIKSEIRTLRELKQFSDLLNYELFEQGKEGLVDVEQLITIIYIFLFYPKYYFELKNFGMLVLDEETEEIRLIETTNSSMDRPKSIKERFYEILIKNEKVYPRQFMGNKGIYYVDEYIKNLSLEEAKKIFSDRNKLEDIISRDNNNDFLAYLAVEYSKFKRSKTVDYNIENIERKEFEKNRNLIEELAVREIKKGNKNQIIDFVVNELGEKIYLESKEIAENMFVDKQVEEGKNNEFKKKINEIEYNKWEPYTQQLSLSEKIKFHIDYLFGGQYIISLLTKLSQEMIKDKEKLALEKHKAYIYYLVTRNFDDYRKNINNIKELVDDLPDSEFIIFWELMGLIDGDTIHIRKMNLDTIISKDNSDIYDLNKVRIEKIFQNSGRTVKINSQP